MKFSIPVLTSALAASALVSGAPLGRRDGRGAVYFITNEPEGNMVIVANINADGTLGLNRAVSTSGRGSHGLADPVGPDALFSQGSIKASATGKILAAVNSGSNTVSLFSIDSSDPTNINLIGEPVSSEGEFPMSLAINGAGNQVCVLNGGTVNGVNCFSVDSKLGLVAMPNTLRSLGLNQTTPATGPAGTTSHIAFSEDGKQLIASVKGVPPTPGFLAVWDVNTDGTLSADFQTVTPGSGGLLPFSMTVIPGKNAILATDAGVGFDIFDFGGQNQSSVVPITGQGATCWSSFSNQTGNFYLTDIITSTVTEVNVDDNLKGTIVKQYPKLQALQRSTMTSPLSGARTSSTSWLLTRRPATAAGVTINANNLQGMTSFVKQ
ncbi:hypothetical protein A0H81_07936 [Grifola frondosa]|uniref:3-carboxymuconate cyclase n=1 Tax=Grifola frondosa TaxID=5627 RepID=A0A1C7M736_GRIFR|nr:hypothetical protein A0H81_07936 [Grifola frondosa]